MQRMAGISFLKSDFLHFTKSQTLDFYKKWHTDQLTMVQRVENVVAGAGNNQHYHSTQ